MKSPDWDTHRRLTGQLSADQDAAAAAAASAAMSASIAAVGATTRGRAQTRAARPGAHDEGSRSRSRSFTIPLRGWGGGKAAAGGGERRQRWASQDSDVGRGRVGTDLDEDEGVRQRASGESGSSGRHSSGRTNSGRDSSSGGGRLDDPDAMERPGRSKSFFTLPSWGGGRRRAGSSSRPLVPAMPAGPAIVSDSSSADSWGTAGSVGGISSGDNQGVGNTKKFALGGGRGRASSTAGVGVGRGAGTDSGSSRTSRFSSFSGGRTTVAPSIDPSPEQVAPAAVSLDPAAPEGAREKNMGRLQVEQSHTVIDSRLPPAVPVPPRSAGKSIGGGWGRGRTSSSAAGGDGAYGNWGSRRRAISTMESDAGVAALMGTPTGMSSRTSSPLVRSRSGSGAGSIGKSGKWPFSRKKRDGLSGERKSGKGGLLGSLQVRGFCVRVRVRLVRGRVFHVSVSESRGHKGHADLRTLQEL